ncbi:MAG: dienelactone hydrolase family protein [Planctomycetaceae bacterium]
MKQSSSCLYVLLSLLLVSIGRPDVCMSAPPRTGFVDSVYRDDTGDHKYVVFLPSNYDSAKKWPVILFLHGAGERGSDGLSQARVGLGPVIKNRQDSFPFITVFPQCEDTRGRILTSWTAQSVDGRRAIKILDDVIKTYSVDPARQILTGWSMGGYGTWSLASDDPKRWTAVIPLSGGGGPDIAQRLVDVPIWAFHGTEDSVVLPRETQRMAAAVTAAGGKPRVSMLKGAGHEICSRVYDDNRFISWMLDPLTNQPPLVEFRGRPGERPLTESNQQEPFRPAVDVSRAAYVRLGNDVLEALAQSIPKMVPVDLLSGQVKDIYDTTVAEGRTFNVQFTGIRYRGKITRTHIKAYKRDRLNIQLALQEVKLDINRTYVTGRSRSAVAGPMSVVIGHRRPVWLSVALHPKVVDRRLKLALIATRFDIQNDNWYVTAPSGVSTRGLGMTSSRVSNALVRGLYDSRVRLETEIQALVPGMLAEFEKNLALEDVASLIGRFWPLPVYRPRLRVWPQEVATDPLGVSLVFGVTAAAVDPNQAPIRPRQVTALGLAAENLPQSTNLEVGIAGDILDPLSRLLIQSDVARIHVQDIPGRAFEDFATPTILKRAIPDLARLGEDLEVWSELILVEPLRIQDASTPQLPKSDAQSAPTPLQKSPGPQAVDSKKTPRKTSGAATLEQPAGTPKTEVIAKQPDSAAQSAEHPFEFAASKVSISLATRKVGQTAWQPYAELDFEVNQRARAALNSVDHETRQLRIDWSGQLDVTASARFAPGRKPADPQIDESRLAELFKKCWGNWTQQGAAADTVIDDIVAGQSRLRADAAGWRSPYLYAKFAPAAIRISNTTNQPISYEIRNVTSAWGGPYTVKPQGFDLYSVGYPLMLRYRAGDVEQEHTLEVGSHVSFRQASPGGPPKIFRVSKARR